MSLIDKDKAVRAIATYLFVNDAIRDPAPRKVVDYETFARSMLKDVPEIPTIAVTASRIANETEEDR